MTRDRRVFPRIARTARLLVQLVGWLAIAPGGAVIGADSTADLSATEFKAAFLSKFLPYVTWPADALPDANQPVVVGLFGYDPFDGLVQKLLEGQTINDRRIVVEVLTDTNRLGRCQVLYVPDDKLVEWLKLKPAGAGRGVLTVGADSTGQFLKGGGVFNLLVDQRKLEISRGNAEKAGLKISAKLLKISKVN